MDSTEQPATAPPSVMPRSSGTTVGASPRGSVARTRVSKVTPGSAVHVRAVSSISKMLVSADVSIDRLEKRRSPGNGTTWWTPPLSMCAGPAAAAAARTAETTLLTRSS